MSQVLVVGSVAYDDVETPAGKVEGVLGGSATHFGVSAAFFTGVRLVACVGEDFERAHLELLEQRGLDLEGLERLEGRTFRWSGRYGEDLNEAETLETRLNVFAGFQPRIPDSYRATPFLFLGNIDPVLQRKVLEQVERPRLVACDTMNYWIHGHRPALIETLGRVDVLLINDTEARDLSGERTLQGAARRIQEWGPRTLVVKRGEYGALMFHRTGRSFDSSIFALPAYPVHRVTDPTGAGDSFAGGFMGYLAGVERTDEEALRQAVVFGSVMASFNVEKFSLNRLLDLTFTEVELRYREFGDLTRFSELDRVKV